MPLKTLRTPTLLAVAALSIVTGLLTACGEALPDPPTPSQLIHQGTQTPPLYVQYCVDRTGSYYPSDDFKTANQYVAESLMQRASKPGQGSTTLYVTLIGANTYAESATQTFKVPATAADESFAPGQSQSDIFAAATPTAIAHEAQATITADEAQVQQQVQQAKAAAAHGATYLQALAPDQDGSTDINGCFQAAQDHFSHAPNGAQKVIVVASDLQDTVTGKPQPFRISGARVLIINFKCDEAAQCMADTKPTWDSALVHDGASSVQFYDPADTQAQFSAGGLF